MKFPCFILCSLCAFSGQSALAEHPNVLMITIDDLNDWVGCLQGHPQAKTPHLDALAKRGVLFTNAHCNAPICNPSRVSFMTGIRPSASGIYLNNHQFRGPNSKIKDAITIAQHLSANGYETLGCGKIFHGSRGRENFETYGPAGGQGPLPKARINCPQEASGSKLWDWGVFPEKEGEQYNDIADANWACGRLQEKRSKPFFLACGFYRPHVPFFAPERFFQMHPHDEVQVPPVLKTDRDDIPAFALKLTHNPLPPSHQWFVESGKWQQAVQSYLACISFTDDNVGKLIAALDESPHADNTWIVLFSDHGFFLGEKQRWAKQALWERATKVPLIMVPPKNRLSEFAAVGTSSSQPVELLSIYPTLMEATGLKGPTDQLQGNSLFPLLTEPEADWPHYAITTHAGNNHAVRDDRYRYIQYDDGSKELYDLKTDPHEWKNLAADPSLKSVLQRLSKAVPSHVEKAPAGAAKNKRAKQKQNRSESKLD